MIFCAAGDPGGSRAVLPVVLELIQRGKPVRVLDHGFLGKELPIEHNELLCNPNDAEKILTSCTVFIFGSSVTDILPLTLARQAKDIGKPVIHVLDNWSLYTERLFTDKLPPLEVDVYAVMDETAKEGALAAGISESCLVVTGHPGFAAIIEELKLLNSKNKQEEAVKLNLPPDKLLLAFVCEPFKQIYGTNLNVSGHPGFTEELVLSAFTASLAPYSEDIHLVLLPHPKQNETEINHLWEQNHGMLNGSVIKLPRSRDILPAVSGIAGMASILLYEAWLGGLPVLSMQPDCRHEAMKRFGLLDGIVYAHTNGMIPSAVMDWVSLCRMQDKCVVRSDLALHEASPEKVADIVLKLEALT